MIENCGRPRRRCMETCPIPQISSSSINSILVPSSVQISKRRLLITADVVQVVHVPWAIQAKSLMETNKPHPLPAAVGTGTLLARNRNRKPSEPQSELDPADHCQFEFVHTSRSIIGCVYFFTRSNIMQWSRRGRSTTAIQASPFCAIANRVNSIPDTYQHN